MLPVSVPQSRSRLTTSRSWGKLQKSAASSLAVASTVLVRDGKKYLLVHPSMGYLASRPHFCPCLSRRDDAGRRLREGAGSLDHPRAAGEGHVRLRHQARLRAAGSTGTHHPWEVPGMGFEHPMGAGIRTRCPCRSPCPPRKPESITPHGFNKFTRGVYLICLIPLLRKQLPAGARRLQ